MVFQHSHPGVAAPPAGAVITVRARQSAASFTIKQKPRLNDKSRPDDDDGSRIFVTQAVNCLIT